MEVKIGDTVILRKHGRYELTDVIAVTPPGMFRVEASDKLFKPDGNERAKFSYHYTPQKCEPHTKERWAKLRAEQQRRDEDESKKRQNQKDEQERRERLHAEQIKNLKESFQLTPENSVRWQQSDGSVVLTIQMPIKPECAERKHGWEVLQILIVPYDNRWHSDETEKFSVRLLHCNGACSGGMSSTWYAPSEDAAIWESIRHVYESNW